VVWNDLDRDGEKEAGEPPLAGAEVRLENVDHLLLGFWKTQADGTYTFANLTPGLYFVSERDPHGYGSSTVGEVAVNLSANQTLAVHFGNYELPTATPTPTATSTPSPTATPTPTATLAMAWRVYVPMVVSRGR
jgi:hypothetical protein